MPAFHNSPSHFVHFSITMKYRDPTPITVHLHRSSNRPKVGVRKDVRDRRRSSLGIHCKPASSKCMIGDREREVTAMSRSSPPSRSPKRLPDVSKTSSLSVRLPKTSPPSRVSEIPPNSNCEKATPAFLAQRSDQGGLSDSILEARDHNCLQTATLGPPITEAGLSELDRSSLFSSIYLRHDLNFIANIRIQRSTSGAINTRRMTQAQAYWDALEGEVAIYLPHWQTVSSDSFATPTIIGRNSGLPKDVPLRLPRMLETICKITKTLVPPSMWAAIDARFDIDLLMQGLRNGACDIAGLSSWLGTILMQSCSPRRDHLIDSMISTIKRGTETHDAQLLVLGLKDLFSLFENMKMVNRSFELKMWTC